MRDALRVFKALSDESRLRLLFALRRGELCVCQLIELMGLSASTVSKHLSILRDAGLLESRKQGRWVFYRVADAPGVAIVGRMAPRVVRALESSETVRADDARLRRIVAMDMEALCRNMAKK